MLYKFSAVTVCSSCGRQYTQGFIIEHEGLDSPDEIVALMEQVHDLIPDLCPECIQRYRMEQLCMGLMDGSAFLEA